MFSGLQSLSSALESTVKFIQFSVVSQETLQNSSSQQEFGDGNKAEQPQIWFSSISGEILHNPCRVCSVQQKSLQDFQEEWIFCH